MKVIGNYHLEATPSIHLFALKNLNIVGLFLHKWYSITANMYFHKA